MIKPRPISGFPEWLPHQKLAEQYFLDTIRYVYELYGYTPLETSAVERVEILAAKGVVDKEIYALGRLREEPGEREEWELGLHFDLTVPLARYVALNYGQLSFPFKRYQVQKVWRGERPQEGRFREFYQADIDVIAEDRLSLHFDAEMPLVIHEIFDRLGVRPRIRVNNRKVLVGFYRGLGIGDEAIPDVLREVDKLEKTGPDPVREALAGLGVSDSLAGRCLALAELRGGAADVIAQARGLGVSNELYEEGLHELESVGAQLADLPAGEAEIDLGIVRGLDYYTGTIYETSLPDHPDLGSICSGGRYDNLASEFINRRLPGVGISIGVSRLVSHLFSSQAWNPPRHCPTRVLVVLPGDDRRRDCAQVARTLRSHGIPAEVYHEPQALKKQMRYADRKGIPVTLFPHQWTPEEQTVEIRHMASGEQVTTELTSWCVENPGPSAPEDRAGTVPG